MEHVDQFVRKVINKMIEIAGYTAYDCLKVSKEKWYQELTWTTEQSNKWKDWFVDEFVKFKIDQYKEDDEEFEPDDNLLNSFKTTAEWQCGWFNLQYGLKIDNSKKATN